MVSRFAARFIGAAVDAGSSISMIRKTAAESPGSLTRIRNANAQRVVETITAPAMRAKSSGAMTAVLPEGRRNS